MTSTHTRGATMAPDRKTVEAAITLASRAPSLHNTQPWHWVFDGRRLSLHGDTDRQLYAADPHGREWLISCGAALHHARTAFAAHGWRTDIVRLPDSQRPDLLAIIKFRPWPDPPEAVLAQAEAIEFRYTDRLPMGEPTDWARLVPVLRALVTPHDLALDALSPNARAQLTEASQRATRARGYDTMYHDELDWWAGHTGTAEGIPPTSLTSVAEQVHVGVARGFPAAPHSTRRTDLDDHAGLAVLGSYDETPMCWLRTGEALSAVLLECTARGLATCALTHLTELPAARRAVADLIPHRTIPQVVLRIGTAPEDDRPPRTARRALTDILSFTDA